MEKAKRLKAVLVGCGGISGAWLPTLVKHADLEMVGLVDLNEDAPRSRAKEFGLTKVAIGTDLEAMIAKTGPDIVFDCTIPAAHAKVTVTALERGCHVLGEKPLADTMVNAKRMIAAADKAGRTYAVIQNRRYDSRIRRLRRFLASGAIGDITTVSSDFYIGAHFGGFRDRMEHVLVLDMAIHTFDAARLISGADPRAVYCREWNPRGSWYDHHASAVAMFEMGDGIMYTYQGSWCADGLNTTWEASWRIIGTKGSLTWDGADGFKAQRVSQVAGFTSKVEDVAVPAEDPADKVGSHAGVINDFIACVLDGRAPETICTDNVKSLAMVLAAIESSDTGRRVEITV